MKAQAHHRLCA